MTKDTRAALLRASIAGERTWFLGPDLSLLSLFLAIPQHAHDPNQNDAPCHKVMMNMIVPMAKSLPNQCFISG